MQLQFVFMLLISTTKHLADFWHAKQKFAE